jgi:hypothetical protein
MFLYPDIGSEARWNARSRTRCSSATWSRIAVSRSVSGRGTWVPSQLSVDLDAVLAVVERARDDEFSLCCQLGLYAFRVVPRAPNLIALARVSSNLERA